MKWSDEEREYERRKFIDPVMEANKNNPKVNLKKLLETLEDTFDDKCSGVVCNVSGCDKTEVSHIWSHAIQKDLMLCPLHCNMVLYIGFSNLDVDIKRIAIKKIFERKPFAYPINLPFAMQLGEGNEVPVQIVEYFTMSEEYMQKQLDKYKIRNVKNKIKKLEEELKELEGDD